MSRAPTLQWQLLPHSWLPERPVPRWGAFPGGFPRFADCGCGSRLIFLISLRPFSSLHPRECGGLPGDMTRGAGCWASSGESGPWSLFLAVSKGNGETHPLPARSRCSEMGSGKPLQEWTLVWPTLGKPRPHRGRFWGKRNPEGRRPQIPPPLM